MSPGDSKRFTAEVANFKGVAIDDSVTWTATGGTITAQGTYTAGPAYGTFRVVGRTTNGLVDTAAVVIGGPEESSPPESAPPVGESEPESIPAPVSIVVEPEAVSLAAGGEKRFTALMHDSDGNVLADPVVWDATGGSIDATGHYVAGMSGGTYRVIGRTSNGLADTALVTIEASLSPVSAGLDQTIAIGDAAILNGTVSDPTLVHSFWEMVSGPGTVTFGHEEFFSGFETGDWSEWRRHENRGDYLVQSPVRSGSYAWAAHADPAEPEPHNHAAKVLHWGSTDYQQLYITAWFYWPGDYVFQEKTGGFLNMLQFKERQPTPDLHDPTWIIGARKATVSGDAEIVVMDWKKSTGTAFYYAGVKLPKDRWVQLGVYIKMHHTSGALIVWVDGQKKWEFRNVNTLGDPLNPSYLMWGVGNYGKDVAEDEALYWDDVRAWRADQGDVLKTTARFSQPGTYVLRLSARSSATTESDEVSVTVR